LSKKGFAVLDKAWPARNYIAAVNSLRPIRAVLRRILGRNALNMKLPANVSAHFDRMMARPSVQRVMQQRLN